MARGQKLARILPRLRSGWLSRVTLLLYVPTVAMELTVSSHVPTSVHIATSTMVMPADYDHSVSTGPFPSYRYVSSYECTTWPAHQSLGYPVVAQPLTTNPAGAQRTDVTRYLSDHNTFAGREELQGQVGSSFHPSPIIPPARPLLPSSAPIGQQQDFASGITGLPANQYLHPSARLCHDRQPYSIPSRSASDRKTFGESSSADNAAGEYSIGNDLFKEFTHGNDFSSAS